MPRKCQALHGKTFFRWHVVSEAPRGKDGRQMWNCVCACGTERAVNGKNLKRGISKSCGCWNHEQISRKKKPGVTKHGMKGTPVYSSWNSMKSRCTPGHKSYEAYKNVKIDPRWMKFEHFYQDMGDRPSGTTLDRVDNDGPYSKVNCRWATARQQCNNRSSNVFIEHNGKSLTISQWSRRIGVSQAAIRRRFIRKMSVPDVLYPGDLRARGHIRETHPDSGTNLARYRLQQEAEA